MDVAIDGSAAGTGLVVAYAVIQNIENKRNRNGKMERMVGELEGRIRQNPDSFLGLPAIKAYEDFFSNTKSALPSTEPGPKILARLVAENGHLPKISRIVDCMNVVSIETGLTMSAWDADRVAGKIEYRFSNGGEKYWPFMGEETELLPGELAAFDDDKCLCLVRFRDSKYAPVTVETKNVVLHVQAIRGIASERVQSALDGLEKLVLENAGGKTAEKTTVR